MLCKTTWKHVFILFIYLFIFYKISQMKYSTIVVW